MDQDAEETTAESSASQPLSYAQITDSSQDLSPSSASRDLFETSPSSRKRPPSSPVKSDNPEPKKQRASSANIRDPAFKFLYTAAKQAGTECKKLMTTIPGPQYYRCRAIHLQHRYGNLADLDLQSPARRNLNDKELDAWADLHRTIAQDALAELIKMSQQLSREHPELSKP